jgi:hypothetical protein
MEDAQRLARKRAHGAKAAPKTENLDDCPFCRSGSVWMISDFKEYKFVRCESCRAAGPKKPSLGLAAAAWNERYSLR